MRSAEGRPGFVEPVKLRSVKPGGKLVRDLVPDLIRAEGGDPVTYRAAPAEHLDRLLAKLVEEAAEAAGATGDDLLEELADVLEVLRAISAHHGVPFDRIEELRTRKSAERGGFAGGVVWLGNRRGAATPVRTPDPGEATPGGP